MDPKRKRSRLDQTLLSYSWTLVENKRSEIHSDGTVSTTSIWERSFGGRKTVAETERLTKNQLKRAMEYAGIENFSFDMESVDISA